MPRRLILPLCLLLLLSALLLPGCSKEKAKDQPSVTGFSCDVDVNYQEMNVKGHLKRQAEGTLAMEVTEPESLKGLSMEWDGETISIKLYGLSFGVDPAQIPESALGKSILNTLDAALKAKDASTASGDNQAKLEGTSENGTFELYYDPQSGALLELKIPDLALDAKFSNFQLLSSDASAA